MFAFLELALFVTLFAGCLVNASRYPSVLLLLPLSFFCVLMAIMGFPKSAYHLLLIGLVFYATRRFAWEGTTKKIVKYFVVTELLFLSILDFSLADWSLQSKTGAPHFYYLWGALLILNNNRNSWNRKSALLLMILDVCISLVVSARGVMIGSIIAFLFSTKALNTRRTLHASVLVAGLFLYLVVAPFIVLLGSQDVIPETASNTQRSLMNSKALIVSMENLFTLDESSVFDAVSEFQYAHDDSNLTVHSLFIAFGLFNGFLPALLLLLLVIMAVRQLAGTNYLPIGVYLYFLMLLGPDSFVTRFALLLLVALVVIRQDRWVPLHSKNNV